MLWWFFQNTLTIAVLVFIVSLWAHVARLRPAARHLLWLVVLLKFMMPSFVCWPWSIGQLFGPTAEPVGNATRATLVIDRRQSSSTRSRESNPARRQDADDGQLPRLMVMSPPDRPFKPSVIANSLKLAVWSLWLLGSGLTALLHRRRIGAYRRVVACAEPGPRWVESEAQRLASRMGVRPPPVLSVPGIASPMVWCLGSPTLLWPMALADAAHAQRSQGVIAHELAHLRRRDHWVMHVELITRCLWWWNPLFWYVRKQLLESAEMACDAWVVSLLPNARREYAQFLIDLVGRKFQRAAFIPTLGVGDGARRSFERRLTMIFSENTSRKASFWGLVGASFLAAFALPAWSGEFGPAAQPPRPRTVSVVNTNPDMIVSIDYSADGSLLAGANFDHSVRIWNAETGAAVRKLEGHAACVRVVCFAPHGTLLASASDDAAVIFWDASTGDLQGELKGHTEKITGMAFSSDGTMLASVSRNEIRVWDVASKTLQKEFKQEGERTQCVAVSPDGQLLAVGTLAIQGLGTVTLWNVQSGTLKERLPLFDGGRSIHSMTFSSNGRWLAVNALGAPNIYLWDVAGARSSLAVGTHSSTIRSLAFSPDGRMLASGSDGQIRKIEYKGMKVTALSSELLIREIVSAGNGVRSQVAVEKEFDMGGTVSSVVFTPDSKRLAACDRSFIRVIDIHTGRELWKRRNGMH